jgi:hypothetical protein
LRDKPGDVDALVGLGEAEFAGANYRAAQRDFSAALRLDPEKREAGERLDLSDEVLALDPSLRGLGTAERSSAAANSSKALWTPPPIALTPRGQTRRRRSCCIAAIKPSKNMSGSRRKATRPKPTSILRNNSGRHA